MENITNVNEYTLTGKFDIAGSFKSDGDSDESKTVTLRFVMDHVPLIDVITPALSTKKIVWVNGPGRSKYDTWKDRSTIEVNYAAPAKRIVTREEKIDATADTFMRARIKVDGKEMTREQAVEFATTAVDTI